eukprot:4166646-Prymnesium_polylepis.1
MELHRKVVVAEVETNILSSAKMKPQPFGLRAQRRGSNPKRRYPPSQKSNGLIFLPENRSPSGYGLSSLVDVRRCISPTFGGGLCASLATARGGLLLFVEAKLRFRLTRGPSPP